MNTKQDSDRIIRELMVKNKDLLSKFERASEQAANAEQLDIELARALEENARLAKALDEEHTSRTTFVRLFISNHFFW